MIKREKWLLERPYFPLDHDEMGGPVSLIVGNSRLGLAGQA